MSLYIFYQVFTENRVIVMPRLAGGRQLWFPLNKLSLLGTIDTKLCLQVAYIKTQLHIATQVSVILVNVTVT
jgi:hypothetical protein